MTWGNVFFQITLSIHFFGFPVFSVPFRYFFQGCDDGWWWNCTPLYNDASSWWLRCPIQLQLPLSSLPKMPSLSSHSIFFSFTTLKALPRPATISWKQGCQKYALGVGCRRLSNWCLSFISLGRTNFNSIDSPILRRCSSRSTLAREWIPYNFDPIACYIIINFYLSYFFQYINNVKLLPTSFNQRVMSFSINK